MSDIKIRYCIDNLSSAPFEDEWDIEGGLFISKDDIVLTKEMDNLNDDGFRGDYVFFNLERWVDSVPKLFHGEECRLGLIDSQETFLFAPKGEFTYFKYVIGGSGHLYDSVERKQISVEDVNKRYPDYEEGTPLKTDELVLEIIRVSELFIDTLGPKIKDKSDVIRFNQALEDAREAYDLYVKRREQN
jgi:hypothetical protein